MDKRLNFLLPLMSALLFALAPGVSKMLLSGFGPSFIAGFSYLSSAFVLSLIRVVFKGREEKISIEKDGWRIILMTASGGVLAPFFLMKGLSISPASSASIILNLETVLTSMIAVFFLKEKLGLRLWICSSMIFTSAILVSFDPGKKILLNSGAFWVAAAALMWAIDNNITASISLKDPLSISVIKGIIGGIVNLFMSFILDEKNFFLPKPLFALFSIGALSYGGSLVLMIYSQRRIGAARTSVIFGSYPIISFIFSVIFLKEIVEPSSYFAFILLCLAFYLAYKEKHLHCHTHFPIFHSHAHYHWELHHDHFHILKEDFHTHQHRHEFICHCHEHSDDEHHRHH